MIQEVIEEVATEEPDPLQREDPWSNSRSSHPESFDVLPTQVNPTPESDTTESWSLYGSTQTSSAPVAVEVAPTTAASPPAGEEPMALRLPKPGHLHHRPIPSITV